MLKKLSFNTSVTMKPINSFSIYPGTVSGSTTRSHSVHPVTVTLLQSAVTSTHWYRYI